MTDNEQDMETDAEMHDDNASLAESWQEEMPPEDDFHDHDSSEEALADEPTEVVEEETAPAPSKKGTGVMLGALAVMAVVIGGLAYLQFSGDSQPARPAPMPDLSASSQDPDRVNGLTDKKDQPTAEAGFTNLPVTPTTSEADIAAIYNSGISKTTAPSAVAMPGESRPDQAAEKMATVKDISTDIVTSGPAAPPPLTGSADARQKPPENNVATQDKAIAVAPVTAPAAPPSLQGSYAGLEPSVSSSTVDARLKELAAQLDAIRTQVQQSSQQLSQLASRLESGQPIAATTALEIRLDQVEHRLSELSASGAKTTKTAPKGETHEKAETPVASSEMIMPAAEAVVETPKPTASKAGKPKTKSSSVRSSSKTKKPAAPRWVLRAATPDAAWVSKDASAAELQQVQVGDTLAGIGTVRSIQQTDDGWMVVGSGGSVR